MSSLSPAYSEIKRLRSNGKCAAALSLMRSKPPASDDDAFEAVVCLFVCGDMSSALNVCQTHAWKRQWAVDMTASLAERLRGGDLSRALSLARKAVSAPGAPYDASAIYLLLLQESGGISEADAYIRTRLQNPPPGEIFLLTILAETAVATKDWRQAYRAASAVLSADPDDYRALVALSVANLEIGNIHESLGNARRAEFLSKGSALAILQIMRCENRLGDHYAALGAFEKLGDRTVIAPELKVELGTAYAALGDQPRAIAEYRAALASDAHSARAIRSLVSIYTIAGATPELDALIRSYPAQIHSDMESMSMLGLSALDRRDLDEAARIFGKTRMLAEANGDALRDLPWPVPESCIRHDYEQLDMLQKRGKLDAAGCDALKLLKQYYDQCAERQLTFAPDGAAGQALRQALSATHYLPEMPIAGPVLGDNDYRAIEEKYLRGRLVVIDNFLSPEALDALRRFCEEATVWKVNYERGYQGALLAQGFGPRVLLALADELRQAMPDVVGPHPLLQAWAFKYDQRMQGINLHADFAKVNVNFWITPDEACDDPESGGMVVYDLPVPKSWTFADYNSDAEKLGAYLKVHKAKPQRVPYRANRCVLFESNLVHITDEMRFKPGYQNRRINVTLLYGKALSVE